MKRKKRTRTHFLPVLAGFLALYLTLMTISTFLIKEKFMESFEIQYGIMAADMKESILSAERDEKWLAEGNTKDAITRYNYILNNILTMSDNEYFQFSCALFDKERILLAKSRDLLPFSKSGDNSLHFGSYPMDEYLSLNELKELAYYVEQMRTGFFQKLPDFSSFNHPTPRKSAFNETAFLDYRITMALVRGTDVPAQIMVQKMNWDNESRTEADPRGSNASSSAADAQASTSSENLLHFPNEIWDHSAIVWTWTNPDIQISEVTQNKCYELEAYPGSAFPYLSYGYENWLAWQENEFLQDLQLDDERCCTMPQYNETADRVQPFHAKTKRVSEIYVPLDNNTAAGSYFLVTAVDCHPWLAAMDSMKYFYLLGFACMLICVCVLTFFISRTNRQRDALEENRRDFTNAMAHELKTPLCVIRGFAENLKENTVAEKRDYYLDQIILKTEEMDTLAAEMIYVSRLDSDKLILKKEPVILNELIETQLEKLNDAIRNQKLGIVYQPEETFCLTGDRQYLEKVIWNLLSNAVTCNIEGGTIQISVSKEQCIIANTGEKIPENDLPHIFEMFYSGQNHCDDTEKHLGLGLYLCRKICSLHHLSLKIRNTEMGVEVILSHSTASKKFPAVRLDAPRNIQPIYPFAKRG